MRISEENLLICKMRVALDRINEKAVQLRDEIGTGSAVAELRARVQNLVEMSRSYKGE